MAERKSRSQTRKLPVSKKRKQQTEQVTHSKESAVDGMPRKSKAQTKLARSDSGR